MIVSNWLGDVAVSRNAGSMGFKNINKRKLETFSELLFVTFEDILKMSVRNKSILFKVEGLKKFVYKRVFKDFLLKLRQQRIRFLGFKVIDKTAHNGCRKSSLKN